MNRIFTLMMGVCMAFSATAQNNMPDQPKLSPLTRKLIREVEAQQGGQNQLPTGYIHRKIGGVEHVSGLIKVYDGATVEQKLDDLGVKVGTRAGDIWTVNVPISQVKAFTQAKGISYIQLDEPLKSTLKTALAKTRADSVHMGIGLPWPMTGKGIIMGVIDFGFDYNHPTLFDVSGSNYRVNKVWELNTTGTPPSGYSYGHELASQTAILAQGTDNTEQTHGTGVAGIASGSGFGSKNMAMKGYAYDAEMVFVGVRRDTIGDQWLSSSFSDFVDGVNYIFSYANSVSKPAVTNISWGSQSGPHDGTSLFSQACDNLSGQGKVIVMSAGNDGQENIHLSKTFTPTDTVIETFVTFTPTPMKRTWVDIWGDTAKTFCAQVTLYSNGVAGNSTGFVCIDDQDHPMYLVGNNGNDTCYVEFLTSSSEYNSKPRVTIDIYNKAADSIHVAIKSTDGSIDVWNEYYYFGYTHSYSSAFESLNMPGAVNGNTQSTVSDMGSAKSVLLVGAYTSATQWTDVKGNPWQYTVTLNGIAPFSSRGPMADGRIKPDIAAPGLTLGTASSSYDVRYTPTGLNAQQVVDSYVHNGKTYFYSQFSGTSASSPAAAGIVAMMLQANPKLTPQDVKDFIFQTALTDLFTTQLPPQGNNTWGHGKINAFGAVKAAAAANSIYTVKGNKPDCALFPNPNNGQFALAYTGKAKSQLQIQVMDVTGRTIAAEQWNVNAGDNLKNFSFPQLTSGTYFVNVTDAGGSISIKTTVH